MLEQSREKNSYIAEISRQVLLNIFVKCVTLERPGSEPSKSSVRHWPIPLKEKVQQLQLRKSSYFNARYRSYSSTKQLCIGGGQRITPFLHENITCRLKFHNDFRRFGTQIFFWDSNNDLYTLGSGNFFSRRLENQDPILKIVIWLTNLIV